MAKTFITERDIEDMARRGELSLTITDDVVLTELAFEKAERLGLVLLQPHQLPPAAPIRPYLSEPVAEKKPCIECSQVSAGPSEEDLRQRIRDAVKAKLGNQIDPALLETIITRVLNNVGIK
ncbi:MAG: hypothetical protein Q7U31_06640 [Anaerolineaceae bacterium]|nr:hypothetical protein [Anaerolineaceae bacterium]